MTTNTCPTCEGSGYYGCTNEAVPLDCPRCNGMGRLLSVPPTTVYCDSAPCKNESQFFDYVLKTFPSPEPHMCVVSPLMPMRTGFGWYVGRASLNYNAASGRWWLEPHDSESRDYFMTEDDARDWLTWHNWSMSTATNAVQ